MDKYVVYLTENRAEIVPEEVDFEMLKETPWLTNVMILAKNGAHILVWARSEEEALQRANNRWRRFDKSELVELFSAVKFRYEMATEFTQEEHKIDDISTLYHELKEVLEQMEEEEKLNKERFYAMKADELPF
jgi:hypothetical protein